MASLSTNKAGQRRLLFVDADDKRRTVYLGKMPMATARQIKSRIEALVAAKLGGVAMDGETARWSKELDDGLYEKLVAVDLLPNRERVRLGPFVADYIAKRNDVKAASKTVWRQGEKSLVDYFKSDRTVDNVTTAEAEDYKQYLIGTKLAAYTVRKRLQFAKLIFNALSKRGHVALNPFSAVQMAAVVDESRNVFVSRDDAARIMEAAPDAEWRAIVALSRFAGLRCPSETLSLKWEHIDWAKQRITVVSPKTAHHVGGGQRTIPLFDELLDPLREAFEAAPAGAVHVVSRYRSQAGVTGDWRHCNLRTGLQRILQRAGVPKYPKPFHALRASCQTELVERVPVQTASAWLGNSPKVALKHYLRVLPEHFDRVTRNTPAKATQCATRQTTQHTTEAACTASKGDSRERAIAEKNDVVQNVAKRSADGVGFDSPSDSTANSAILQSDDAPNDARGDATTHLNRPADPALTRVVALWPTLDDATRQAIIALADEAVYR